MLSIVYNSLYFAFSSGKMYIMFMPLFWHTDYYANERTASIDKLLNERRAFNIVKYNLYSRCRAKSRSLSVFFCYRRGDDVCAATVSIKQRQPLCSTHHSCYCCCCCCWSAVDAMVTKRLLQQKQWQQHNEEPALCQAGRIVSISVDKDGVP